MEFVCYRHTVTDTERSVRPVRSQEGECIPYSSKLGCIFFLIVTYFPSHTFSSCHRLSLSFFLSGNNVLRSNLAGFVSFDNSPKYPEEGLCSMLAESFYTTEGKDVKSNITQSGVVRMSAPQCVRLPTKEATPTTPPHNRATQKEDKMEIVIKDCADNSYMIEVDVDDTTETMRQKVASAVGLAEDSFHMGFGGKEEGEDITQLSAGDTIILTKTKKFVARAALHALGERDITAERLVTVEDPEVACLLLQAEVATVIPNNFLAQTSLTSLDLSAVSCVTEIGDEFLHQCTMLTSVDLSGLTRLTRIGTNFLADCTSLTAVNLSPLSNVTHIGTSFLYSCTSLTAVDLSPLRNVTHIDDRFLNNCSSLTAVDLSPLRNVTQIHDWFLDNCTSLTAVDLSPLRNVTQFGYEFLANCRSLTAVDLALSNVTHIDTSFLFNCNSLTEVDLSPLRNVTQIGCQFLAHCSSLTAVDLSPLSNVTHIGTSFLPNCNSLTAVDLSPLRNVTQIRHNFLYSCSRLTAVDLSPLSNVTQIEGWFLENCTSLKVVDLSPLRNVTQIGRGFLYNCSNLTELDLSPLSRVTHFGELPANNCISLRSIYLTGCSSAVSSRVRECELKEYVVDAPPPPPPTRGRGKTKAAVPCCSVS